MINNFLILFFIITSVLHANTIQFSASSLVLNIPTGITASGNTNFKNDDLSISADTFFYDTATNKGTFNSNVVIKQNKSELYGNSFFIDQQSRHITGFGNIVLKTNSINAKSDNLKIENYEILTLLNNVKIKQNGSQILSNQLIYNMKTDTIISNKRTKLIYKE
ncbi:MAG: LptA/OstA family protein [Candidatus Margulisiibacteriota bacterium]|nr:LptA/OstA family protein [Candidatus Margulisiibacteriota bacterium]